MARLGDIRRVLEEEKRLYGEEVALYQQYDTELDEVGAKVAEGGFQNVLHRFYDIVVQSDVGIIDVAWALKQQKTDEVSRLVREQKNQLNGLDQEFKEVLEESE